MKVHTIVLQLIFLFCGTVFAQFEGQALQFDGVNDYVDLGNSTIFNIDSASTYEAWINPDTTLTGFIFAKWVAFAEDIQLGFSGNKIFFYLHNVFGGVQLYTSTFVPLHQYTHIAASYNASAGIAKLYINGVFDTSKSVGSSVSNSTGNLYLGFNPVRGDFIAPFKGIIDEARIWNIARTQSEIQSTMNQSLNGNETGLVGYWNFNEGSGSVSADQTSNGNDGTISGAVWIPGITSVKNEVNSPALYSLSQNFPNPFNPTTTIRYSLPFESDVKISVFNILGEKVRELVNEQMTAGSHSVNFSAGNLASGIYIYNIDAKTISGEGDFITCKKMILLK